MASDQLNLDLIDKQVREHQELTRFQLVRDGQVWDSITKQWITRDAAKELQHQQRAARFAERIGR